MLPLPRPLLSSKPHQFFSNPKLNFSNFFSKNTPNSHRGSEPFVSAKPSPSTIESNSVAAAPGSAISLHEWQGWGTTSPLPSMVNQVIQDLKLLEKDIDAQMTFDGNHGRLSGDFKVQVDKKHRAKYASLGNSEEKLQFFSARQIACRLLGSRGYLCQKCWLPLEDCMCSRVTRCSLWKRVRLWLYMHPKDFLRKNNTGKLLWQVFGVQAATLCLFGITEHEEMMWNEFNRAGRNKAWCLYPNKSVKESFAVGSSKDLGSRTVSERAESIWGQDLRCISLNTGVSSMHRLRPQPSWDRTCTAAAAVGLLDELHLIPELGSFELDKQAKAIENALEVLLEALTVRRLRMGRSISRRETHTIDIC